MSLRTIDEQIDLELNGGKPPTSWGLTPRSIVSVQVSPEWPAREYAFSDPQQARMFAHSCRRDGDYHVEVRGAAA